MTLLIIGRFAGRLVDDPVIHETPPRRPDNAIVLTGRAWVSPDHVDMLFFRSGGPEAGTTSRPAEHASQERAQRVDHDVRQLCLNWVPGGNCLSALMISSGDE